MTPEWTRLEALVSALPATGNFEPEVVAEAPEPVRRYFEAGITPGTPLAAAVRLEMRGSIKIGRWLPFRARQLLAPALGTVWEARVAGVISGSDRYVEGSGGMDWKLFGRRRLVHAEGPDVSRSAAERAAGESIWVPTALVPTGGVEWTAVADDRIAVEVDTDGRRTRVEHGLDPSGALVRSSFVRWGDPDNTGTWGRHPFGVEVTGQRTFDGVTIPAKGRAGWHYGTGRWESGVFFRYEITGYELVT
ncbi:MAG TPA: DUF6544 family protein [Acidimicrobiia bacterium]|nr:DUF6544 family protein [Acidimicrobiia bacterium]